MTAPTVRVRPSVERLRPRLLGVIAAEREAGTALRRELALALHVADADRILARLARRDELAGLLRRLPPLP